MSPPAPPFSSIERGGVGVVFEEVEDTSEGSNSSRGINLKFKNNKITGTFVVSSSGDDGAEHQHVIYLSHHFIQHFRAGQCSYYILVAVL